MIGIDDKQDRWTAILTQFADLPNSSNLYFVPLSITVAAARDNIVRGFSFSADENSSLAGCWAGLSANHDEQDANSFWNNVNSSFTQQPEACERLRVAASLHSRWKVLQRAVQKYLAAKIAFPEKW
eukprot:IDg9273t1